MGGNNTNDIYLATYEEEKTPNTIYDSQYSLQNTKYEPTETCTNTRIIILPNQIIKLIN